MKISASQFCTACLGATGPDEVASKLGVTRRYVLARASRLRKRGVAIELHQAPVGRKPLDVEELNRILAAGSRGATDEAP